MEADSASAFLIKLTDPSRSVHGQVSTSTPCAAHDDRWHWS